jgi:hypothetical protein
VGFGKEFWVGEEVILLRVGADGGWEGILGERLGDLV